MILIRKILVIDLDATLYIEQSDMEVMHPAHELSPQWINSKAIKRGETFPAKIKIINPSFASALIDKACTECAGVIVLTAGFWDEETTKKVMKAHLDVSVTAERVIDNASFLSPATTAGQFPDLTEEDIRSLNKDIRLDRHIELNPELADCHFVVLDDSKVHINSFAGKSYVTAIRATTDTESTEFYELAMNALNPATLSATDEDSDFDLAPLPPNLVGQLFENTDNTLTAPESFLSDEIPEDSQFTDSEDDSFKEYSKPTNFGSGFNLFKITLSPCSDDLFDEPPPLELF